MKANMELNDFCMMVIAYLYIDSWITAFRMRSLQRKLEKVQSTLNEP